MASGFCELYSVCQCGYALSYIATSKQVSTEDFGVIKLYREPSEWWTGSHRLSHRSPVRFRKAWWVRKLCSCPHLFGRTLSVGSKHIYAMSYTHTHTKFEITPERNWVCSFVPLFVISSNNEFMRTMLSKKKKANQSQKSPLWTSACTIKHYFILPYFGYHRYF